MTRHFHLALMVLLVAAMLVPAAPARADRWYQSGWVIGGAGLLVGTIIGASIVESGRTTRHVTTYETRPVYVVQENPRWVSTNYVEETRVWPFYRRTRVFPVITRTEYQHEAVSMAHRVRPGQAPAPSTGTSGGIEIKVGDNNQNVNINVNTGNGGREAVRTRTVTIPNAPAGMTGGRMVDIQVPVEDEKEAPAAADNEEADESASE